jgi:2-isopropylmalate synthase
MRIEILDSTLRDGAQGESISFSLDDKLKIFRRLSKFGIPFIEAGTPRSNPKDIEFFERINKENNAAKAVAFGATKRAGIPPENDENLLSLIEAETEYVSVFGKSWDFHAEKVLGVSLPENLDMIRKTIEFLTAQGRKVFFDAEHYFDGYKKNKSYALQTLKTAVLAGARRVILCDTNGGCFPNEIADIVKKTAQKIRVPLGIHTHNDTGCAIANTISAVQSGVRQVQGTFTGIGERTGNANLSAVIANLQGKLGFICVPAINTLSETAYYISETANITLPANLPYVGGAAFAHKGGMHADGVTKNTASFEHISPETVGNRRRFIISELMGRSTVAAKIRSIAPELKKDSEVVRKLTEKVKYLERAGYQFEAADATFELMVLEALGKFNRFFEILRFRANTGQEIPENTLTLDTIIPQLATAVVKVKVNGQYEIDAGEGDGPVNAIDNALRKSLTKFYPRLSEVQLTDYKVRIAGTGTSAITRVLIESTNGKTSWTTVGASKDIINASILALSDSLNYALRLQECVQSVV